MLPQSQTMANGPDSTFSLGRRVAIVNRSNLYLNADHTTVTDENRLFDGYSDELLTFAWVACIVFIIVGVPGNLLTIVALSRGRQTRNSTAIFIINLSCSDLLFGCFNLPLAASTFMERAWTHSELLCQLFPLLRYGLLAVSLLSVSLITINRYIIIAHPRQYPRIYQRRYLALMVASTWIITFSIMIPTWRGVWGRFGLDPSIGSCSILHDKYDRSPKEFLFMLAFILPCVCIVICYARIFLLVRQAAIRAGTTNKNSPNDATTIAITPPANATMHAKTIPPPIGLAGTVLEREKQSASSAEVDDVPTTPRPFIVNEYLAFIDDNASADSLPISYSIRRDPKESAIEANVVLNATKQNTENAAAAAAAAAGQTGSIATLDTSGIRKSQTVLEKNPKYPITTSLRTSFTRFSPRKSHYVSMGNTSNASSIYPGRMSAKDRRLLKMILVIFVWFVICYLPITVTKIWKTATDVHLFNIMGYLLIYLTTCINPLIYVLMSSEYRRAYWNLLRCHQTKSELQQQQQTHLHNAKKKHTESNRVIKT